MLKLYYTASTCSLATHIVLEEVGADYSTVRIDFATEQQKSAEYLKINPKARVPLCGLIAGYNAHEAPSGPDRLPALQRTLLTKRVRIQGFIVFDDYGDRQPEFLSAMAPWVREGKIKFREDVVDGLEQAPEAFIGLLEGRNFGKLVVRVAQD